MSAPDLSVVVLLLSVIAPSKFVTISEAMVLVSAFSVTVVTIVVTVSTPLQLSHSSSLRQRVCCALMLKPELQLAHIATPFTVHAAPVLGVPFAQLQKFRAQPVR